MTAKQWRFAPYGLPCLLLGDLLVGLMGAGPPGVGFWTREAALVVVSLLAMATWIVVEGLLLRIGWLARRRWALVPAVIVGMILVMGPATWGIAAWLAPPAHLSGLLSYIAMWTMILPVVALFGPIARAVRRLIVEAEAHSRSGLEPKRFLQRLPAELYGAKLWAIEAQDHYLRLHTSKGRAMILMRLADAMIELDGLEGARVHRSWWMARDALAGVRRADGRVTLRLPDGSDIPVSRTYASELRREGWI